MRFLLAFVCLISTSLSFAFVDHHEHHKAFEGEGRWVSTDGETGDYHVRIDGFMFDDHLDIVESYKVEGSEESYSFSIVKKENGFAHIMKGGEKIGYGYCFENNDMKLCHHTYTFQGWTVETTCHMAGGTLKRVGSVQGGEDNKLFKFIDKLRVVHDGEQEDPWNPEDPRQHPKDPHHPCPECQERHLFVM